MSIPSISYTSESAARFRREKRGLFSSARALDATIAGKLGLAHEDAPFVAARDGADMIDRGEPRPIPVPPSFAGRSAPSPLALAVDRRTASPGRSAPADIAQHVETLAWKARLASAQRWMKGVRATAMRSCAKVPTVAGPLAGRSSGLAPIPKRVTFTRVDVDSSPGSILSVRGFSVPTTSGSGSSSRGSGGGELPRSLSALSLSLEDDATSRPSGGSPRAAAIPQTIDELRPVRKAQMRGPVR